MKTSDNIEIYDGEQIFTDSYVSEYNYDQHIETRQLEVVLDVESGDVVTKVVDYANRVRSRAIEEIRKVQAHNL